MFDCWFCEVRLALGEVGDYSETGLNVGWRFAQICCNDVLEVGRMSRLQYLKKGIADPIYLRLGWLRPLQG